MTVTDDSWCDWCALEIRGVPLRVDGRVFCNGTCLSTYRAGFESPSVIELPCRPNPEAIEESARLESEGPQR
ncbi:hypothetical protein NONO_c14520 [Nocardia nova SH22a]|uniref:TRASH domain-containing protein n=1 Tax=Nocardia nova SH22a TaxID=1415166 RepID=W5TA88_9NOCA|nr:hypothetical protein NONO_c14520 [Nocardia nova SH22a]